MALINFQNYACSLHVILIAFKFLVNKCIAQTANFKNISVNFYYFFVQWQTFHQGAVNTIHGSSITLFSSTPPPAGQTFSLQATSQRPSFFPAFYNLKFNFLRTSEFHLLSWKIRCKDKAEKKCFLKPFVWLRGSS